MEMSQQEFDENQSRNEQEAKDTGGKTAIQEKLEQIQKRKIRKRRICQGAIGMLVIGLIFTFSSTIMLAVVEGNSMRASFLPEDKLIVQEMAVDYKRNDVVLVEKEGKERIYIKRIIGIPGDEIMITENGSVSCNRKIEEIGSYGYTDPGNLLEYPVKLGKQEYFVLGDNREKSADSRTFGIVKRDELKGKVLFLFWRKI